MLTESNYKEKQRIHLYDGYRNEPIWKQSRNCSTQYDFDIDKQCTVPLGSLEEIKRKYGIK